MDTNSLKGVLIRIMEIDMEEDKTPEEYHKRTVLVYEALAIAAHLGYSCGIRVEDPQWPVISIQLPGAGQVAWHCQATDRVWDGHSDSQKADRIQLYVTGSGLLL